MKKVLFGFCLLFVFNGLSAQITWMGNEYTTLSSTQYLGDQILFEIQSYPIALNQGAQVYIDWNNNGYSGILNIDYFVLNWIEQTGNNSKWNKYVTMLYTGTHNRKYLGWQTGFSDYITANMGTFEVSALNNPSSQTASRNALAQGTKVDLSWSKDAQNHFVMIVRKLSTDTWTEPIQGTVYSVSNTIGAGTVVYAANSGTLFTDENLTSGLTYDYKFYSENNSYYSAGVTASVTTGSATTDYFRSKTNGNWHANSTWESSMNNTNWIDATRIPTSSANNTSILNTHTVTVTDAATVNNLTIESGGVVNINASKSLTVSGAFSNSGTVTLKSPASSGAPGSLITNGSVSGNIVAERYIPAYTVATDGWHLISSPVNNMTIAGSNLAPGTNDDLFKYDEVNNLWLNYKVGANNITNFTNGIGFLCAYETGATKSFTGIPNRVDVEISGLTRTSTRGWNLLGNPYPSAIKWNDGNWTITNVNTTAKVMNPGGTYSDKTANGIIPAMQGFFVQVTSGTGTVKIPILSRTHDATTNFYKQTTTQAERLMLTAQSDDNNTFVESVVQFDPLSTNQYEDDFDAHFLQGILEAPQMYSVVGNDDYLSTNTLPPSSAVVVPVNFIKGISDNYTMNATGIESFSSGVTIFLEDLKTGTTQDLAQNPLYSFSALASDDPNRFKMHFGGTVSTGDETTKNAVKVYSSGKTLYVNNSSSNSVSGQATIYNLLGQVVATHSLDNSPVTRIQMSTPPGYYLVKVVSGTQTYTGKVFIN